MNKVKQIWSDLRTSLWFIPGLMITASIALALILIEVDSQVKAEWLAEYPRIFGLGVEGARGMLTAIASSMLTVAALVFSLTLSAVTQASAQFTPRIFRNFIRDRANQFVLGYFVSVFAYCLIVLRTIRGVDELKFIPSFAVLTGLLLALGGIIVLIFYIHHIANSLQISTILDKITVETLDSIKKLFPQETGDAATTIEKSIADQSEQLNYRQKIPALKAGYLQNVAMDELLDFAAENRLLLKMQSSIGSFIGCGSTLAEIAPDTQGNFEEVRIAEETFRQINDFFEINRHRTIEKDAGFGIRQIVDIALKALSPGINDTTTAITCIDRLGEIIGELAARKMPERVRSKNGVPRIIVSAPTFAQYVEKAFDQIRTSGKANAAIFERLLTTLGFIADRAKNKTRHHMLEKQLRLVSEYAEQTLETEYEKERVRAKYAAVRENFIQ